MTTPSPPHPPPPLLSLGAASVPKLCCWLRCPPAGQESRLLSHVVCQKFCFVVLVVVYWRIKVGTFQLERHISLCPIPSNAERAPKAGLQRRKTLRHSCTENNTAKMKMNDSLWFIKASLLWSSHRKGIGSVLLVDYKWPWPVLKKGWDTHNSCTTLSSASCINESSWNWAESRANTIVRLGTGVIWRHLGLNPAPVDPQWFMFNDLIAYCWLYRHIGIQLYFIGMLRWKCATFKYSMTAEYGGECHCPCVCWCHISHFLWCTIRQHFSYKGHSQEQKWLFPAYAKTQTVMKW